MATEYQFLDPNGLDKMLVELRSKTDILYAPRTTTDARLKELENSITTSRLATVEVVEETTTEEETVAE